MAREALARLSTKTLTVLYDIAKQRRGGVRPFFRDPRVMIALRDELMRRKING